MTWQTKTLGEICDAGGGIIKTGPFGSQLHESDYVDRGLPVVMPKDIVGGRVVTDSIAQIDGETAHRLSQHALKPGDIVYGRRGDIGRQALITERERGWLCGTGCLRVTLGKITDLDPQFLHYYLREAGVISWISNQAVGATMPNLNTSILRSVPVRLPPLATQRKIAAVLSAYDDLIENNTRRVRVLEQMARALYREWFVEYRFPGHEQVQWVEDEGGRRPEGWEWKQLGELASVNSRSIKKGKAPAEVLYVDLSSVGTGVIEKTELLPFEKAPGRARRLAQHGDTIWATVRPNRRSFALVLNPDPRLVVSTGFAVISPKEVPLTYLYQAITTEEFSAYLVGRARGAAYPAVVAVDFEEAPLLLPDSETLRLFHERTEALMLQQENLRLRNANLRRTRDLLLPRLVSGELDVSELAIVGAMEGGDEQ